MLHLCPREYAVLIDSIPVIDIVSRKVRNETLILVNRRPFAREWIASQHIDDA